MEIDTSRMDRPVSKHDIRELPPARGPKNDPTILTGFDSEEAAPAQPDEAPLPTEGAPLRSDDAPLRVVRSSPDVPRLSPVARLAPMPERVPAPVLVPAADSHVTVVPLRPVLDRSSAVREAQPDDDVRAFDQPEHDSPVSLRQLRSAELPLRWYEAVAIVQGMCEAMIVAGQETSVPGLETVFVRSQGDIYTTTEETGGAAAAVNAVGQIFDQLGGPDLPAPLKFIVAKASAVPPIYGSIKEFSATLAYFERPNRVELLQGVHAAWTRLPVAAAPPPLPPVIVRVAEPLEPPAVVHAARIPGLVQRGAALALVAVGLAVIGIVFLTLGMRSRTGENPAPAPAMDVARSGEASPPTADTAAAAQPGLPGGQRAEVGGERLPGMRSDKSPRLGGFATPPQGNRRPASGRAPDVDTVAALEAESVPPGLADGATYTAADTDVIPPVAVYPKLPSLDPSLPDVAAFEIVVSSSGNVESVKANDSPASVGQAMQMTSILSAAKSWRFRPAWRAGHSVRYRVLVWLQLH
jgi:hypothetical protein